MKRLLTIAALLISAISFAQSKQERTVSAFTGISAATGIEVEITQGNADAVSVSVSDDRYLAGFKTEVAGGILKIYYDGKSISNSEKSRRLRAFVTYKQIDKLSGSSGASIKAINTISSPSLSLELSSGALFNGDVKATDFLLDQSSGAISDISGSATSLTAKLSTGSISKAGELNTDNCTVKVSTGASLKVSVSKALVAKASTGGIVSYKGNPTVNRTRTTGGIVSKM